MILAFPVLKMHGDYLAIVTLGFGEIIRLVLNNWLEFTGGPNGAPVPAPTFLGLEFTRTAKQGGVPIHEYLGIAYSADYRFWFLYFVLFLVVCFVIYAVERLRVIPLGRMWEALREDEIACRSLGVNHVFTKLTAFMLGASTGGLAKRLLRRTTGLCEPDILHVLRIRAHPGDRRPWRPRIDGGRHLGRTRSHHSSGASA